MASSTFTGLRNHHRHLVPEFFIAPDRTLGPLKQAPRSPIAPAPGKPYSALRLWICPSGRFPCSGSSNLWPSCLASGPRHVSKVHPRRPVCHCSGARGLTCLRLAGSGQGCIPASWSWTEVRRERGGGGRCLEGFLEESVLVSGPVWPPTWQTRSPLEWDLVRHQVT